MQRKKFLKLSGQLVAGSILLQACKGAEMNAAQVQEKQIIKSDQKIGFFGDSITFDGRYIKFLEEKIRSIAKYEKVSLHNFGKNSETVSGLSEAIHDPIRPLLFDRIDTIYNENKPDFLFFCYGINDAIYHPFSAERFKAYVNGVARFLDFAKTKDHQVVMLTPGPFGIFDDARIALEERKNQDYSWKNPHPGYDQVMKQYRDYILSIDHPNVVRQIDIHTPLSINKNKAYGNDPIHPTEEGHRIIAEEIYKAVF